MKIAEFREYIRVVRALLDGDEVEYTLNGRTRIIDFLHKDMGFFNLQDRVPIYVAANGPLALRTVGEMGDGLMSVFNEQPAVLEQNLGLLRQGAARAERNLCRQIFRLRRSPQFIPLAKDEPINSERVIDEAGPWAVAALHFVWELFMKSGDEAVVPPAFQGVFRRLLPTCLPNDHVGRKKVSPDPQRAWHVHCAGRTSVYDS